MKKIFIALLLFISTITLAQDKKSLEEGATKMYNYTVNAEYDKLLDITYPKIFTLIPKEKMLQAFESMVDNEQTTIKMLDEAPNFKYGAITKVEDGYYCIIDHDLAMEMTFKEAIPKDQSEMVVNLMKKRLETDKVIFDPEKNSITVHKRAQVIAIANKLSNNKWTYINNDKNSPYVKMLLNESVRTKLGL
ncbi:MAG: hypothetical protein BM557_10180 [Flavobacterium sp. MedPE-SWcel]|uniref:hypothetical protein n=1 Tax=uncultured Flavobacterium sp. TaxID=165435 RepID=UPI00091A8183|nr:hypothetical protein [uncultured Flavobacterium sp.]OIQ16229.1 MAG: hypothetical protein BM557_10180 [Flavobacterium sp. MedPE-SWcel]